MKYQVALYSSYDPSIHRNNHQLGIEFIVDGQIRSGTEVFGKEDTIDSSFANTIKKIVPDFLSDRPITEIADHLVGKVPNEIKLVGVQYKPLSETSVDKVKKLLSVK